MKNIELVVFDLDGTLINAYPAIIDSFNYTMQRLKLAKQRPLTIRQAVGWGDKNLLRPFVNKSRLSTAVSIYRRHHRATILKKSRLFKRAEEVLTRLKHKGYKLAVASNRPTKFSWILIKGLKLDKYFDYVLCADRLDHIKPHPEILNRIIERFQISPQKAVYVGDMVIDAQAGRRANIKTVIVTTGSSSKREIKKERPYRIINKISQILNIL
jgi:HAD superfamily hydrolase (TIGR01509 family)